MSEFSGKRVAIIGAAATGRAAAPVLARLGASLVVYDAKPEEQLAEAAAELRAAGIFLRLGDASCPGIEAAEVIVPSPGVPASAPVLREAVARGVPVLSEIEVAYRIAHAPILGITGTNGKTTTTLLVAACLAEAGIAAEVCGNTLAGGRQLPLIRAAAEAPPERWLVAEISSFQLEWVERFAPRVAVITNITADHLDRHGTPEAYAAAKARLLDAQAPDDWAVLNAGCPVTAALAERGGARRLWFTRADPPERGAWVEEKEGERRLFLRLGETAEELLPAGALRLPGEHSLENALAAAGAAGAAGAPAQAIARALAAFRGVPDRLEYLTSIRGVEYVNNSMCTNVDAAVRSVRAYGRPLVVIAGGKDKGESDFRPLGEALTERARALVAIGESGPRIAAAARAAGLGEVREAGSMQEAVRLAAELARAGDVVLLAPGCASFDWFRSFEHRGEAFREAVFALGEERVSG